MHNDIKRNQTQSVNAFKDIYDFHCDFVYGFITDSLFLYLAYMNW